MMRYGTKLYKIPTPELYILYIGNSRLNIKELQLSDTFNEQTDSLQLRVKVIDIHIDMLIESGLDKCKPLFGYSTFLEKCNALGVEDAISYCIEHDILADFLKKYNADVKKIFTQTSNKQNIFIIRSDQHHLEYRGGVFFEPIIYL